MSAERCRNRTAVLVLWQRRLDDKERRLLIWERRLAEREERLDRRWLRLDQGEGRAKGLRVRPSDDSAGDEYALVEQAWTVPPERVIVHLRRLMAETGDDATTTAWGLGLDPAWVGDLLAGRISEIDIAHVRSLCEGLACTPGDLLGEDLARSIAHLYGAGDWPVHAELLRYDKEHGVRQQAR